MTISSSIIPSFSSPKPRGLISGARNFVTGQKPGLKSIIENISSPHKSTSNFLTVFGSDNTEEILKKSVKTLRTTLLDVFELSRVLVVAIEEISKSLKNLSLSTRGSGGGLLGNLLKGALIGGGLGTGAVVGNKLTKKVVQEGGEQVTTQVGKRIAQKTTPQVTKGIVPKLVKKSKWLAPLALLGLGGLPWLFGGDGNASVGGSSVDGGSIKKFSSHIDSFTLAVESLKERSPVSSDNITEGSDGEPGTNGSDGVQGATGTTGATGATGTSGSDGIVRIVEPKRSDFPNTRSGAKKFIQARKDYHSSIKGQDNNNLKKIENLNVGANQSMINVIPYNGMPTQTGGGSGGNLNVPTSSGASPDLPFLSSSKSDSFATLESKMIYNIVE